MKSPTAGPPKTDELAVPETPSVLAYEIAEDFASLAVSRDVWDAFVADARSDVYFSYDWCRIWWKHYGSGRGLKIVIFRRDGQLVGIVPLVIDRLWLGPVPVRMAKLVGSDSTIVVLSPAVRDGHTTEVYGTLVKLVLGELGCDCLWLGPLSGEASHLSKIVSAVRECDPWAKVIQAGQIGVHITLALPATMEEYLAGLSKSARGNYRRDCRNLENQCEMRSDTVSREGIEQAFEEFVAMHREQWEHVGKLGHFGDWPGSLEFNRDLVRQLAPARRVLVERLIVNGQTVQSEYSLVFADNEHWRLPARRVGDEWDRFGLGRVGRVIRFQTAIASGIRRVEAGPGHYDYKLKLGGIEWPLDGALISSPRRFSILKTRILKTVAFFLHLLYYRIWFNRILPKLPLRRHPLWRRWVRMHL